MACLLRFILIVSSFMATCGLWSPLEMATEMHSTRLRWLSPPNNSLAVQTLAASLDALYTNATFQFVSSIVVANNSSDTATDLTIAIGSDNENVDVALLPWPVRSLSGFVQHISLF